MLFQVFNNEGICAMRCSDTSCVPDCETLKDMYNAGYRFKIDGKQASLKTVKEVFYGV